MANAKKKIVRGESLDIDSLYLEAGYEPPRINVRKAIEKAAKKGKVKDFSYALAAEKLGLRNSNNIAKWFKNQNLNFNTLKMIMYVLDCSIEDLIEPSKRANKSKKTDK